VLIKVSWRSQILSFLWWGEFRTKGAARSWTCHELMLLQFVLRVPSQVFLDFIAMN
jgi:hypothetical protein